MELLVCPACDCLLEDVPLRPGEQARCRRCSDVIKTRKPHAIERTLAVSLAAIVLLTISLVLPFLSLSRAGLASQMSVLDAVYALWMNGMGWLGWVTLALIVLLPLTRFSLLAWVMWRVRRTLSAAARSRTRTAFRWALWLEPWAMAEIFMVGVVVSLVKIGTVARLQVGPAFWALLALVAVSVLLSLVLCRTTVWHALDDRYA